MVIWSKSFDHDHGQNFLNNLGQMVKILTMTTSKIQIFHGGQNGTPKFIPQILSKNAIYLTNDHGANSKVSMVMVKFFDH